ncbi:MAG: hypothetical protein DHS20C16_12060 [Phycisphaerae bacterium]|nr:MAG: hypothetical protein DHS20C16_12060 [Phycisphaerae bacterium]
MTPEEYQKVAEIFADACQRDEAERSAFLDKACADDAALRARVEAMLRSDSEGDAFLQQAAVNLRAGIDELTDANDGDPETVGRYRIIRKLGSGGMGVVYLAEQDQPRRFVAIKLIRPGLLSLELLRRFEFEAQVLGQLRHPGIAHVYEASTASESGGQSYFAMEYVEGPPLDQHVRERNLSTRDRLEMIARICDAVQHAHQKGVIHRDLKPANILVDESGQPKILDFGVARATNSDTQLMTMQTNVGQIIGTIAYMSPEQVTGVSADIDTRSDVYALGVICFELLSQRLPLSLRDRSIPEAARMIQDEEPSRLRHVDATMPADVETIVAKALEKDKERRYQSAAELADDIRRYLRHEPIVARPQTTLYQLKKFAMRNRGLTVALCGVVVALVAGLISTSIYAYRADQQRSISEERFEDLRSFAQKVIVDYQNMQRAKGETKAREYLSVMAQEYLDEMARDTKGLNLRVLADLAKAYTAIGDVQGRPFGSNLGNPQAALANYEKSVAINEDIVKRDPTNPAYKRELAIACERVGNIHLSNHRHEEALSWYQRSHKLKLAIVDEDATGQRNLSYSYAKLGDVFIKIDRQDEAYDMYAKSLDIRKQLADASPDNDSIQRAYTVGLNRFADVLLALDRNEEALVHYENSLDRRLKRLIAQPDNNQARMDAAVGHLKHGDVLTKLDRIDEALAALKSSRTILSKMAEDDPGNTTARLGVAQVSSTIAQTLFDADRLDEAHKVLTELLAEYESDAPVSEMHKGLRQILATSHWLNARTIQRIAGSAPAQDDTACRSIKRSNELFGSLGDESGSAPRELTEALGKCQETSNPPS